MERTKEEFAEREKYCNVIESYTGSLDEPYNLTTEDLKKIAKTFSEMSWPKEK